MFDSVAVLMSEVAQALGHPNREYLDPEDLARAAIQTLSFYGLSAQQSPHARISKKVPLNMSKRDSKLNVNDLVAPLWVERKMGSEPNEFYEWIPTVDLSVLEESFVRGDTRAAFYKEQDGYHVRLTYDPTGIAHRLWYYGEADIGLTPDSALGLPVRFGFMFVHKTVINVVPMMLTRSAQLEEEQQMNSTLLDAIGAAVAHAQGELGHWEELWETEKRSDRNVRGRSRRRLLGRRRG